MCAHVRVLSSVVVHVAAAPAAANEAMLVRHNIHPSLSTATLSPYMLIPPLPMPLIPLLQFGPVTHIDFCESYPYNFVVTASTRVRPAGGRG